MNHSGKSIKQKAKAPAAISKLISDLGNEDGRVREKARRALVKMGAPAIDYLTELVYAKKDRLRWEAIKAMGQIADPVTAPFLINAFEDDDPGVRWLAAEGLINLGPVVVEPVVKAVVERIDSVFIRAGAHHVLNELNRALMDKQILDLLHVLRNTTSEEKILLFAGELLERIEREKYGENDEDGV